jgi:hypothetical protein
MFTSNPPVKLETDEKNRADVLHASALAMAKKMYDQQQKIIDSSARMHTRSSSFSGGDTASLASSRNEEQPPLVHNSLQEAAYRLAQERLANLQEEHDKQRGFQEYYGAGTAQRTKLGTIKGKLSRRRSSSDGDLLEDQRRSDQIRKQMSFLNNKVAEVDEEKRARDRETLLAAAHRNVRAQLQEMDNKVQSDTGRVPQIDMDGWGRKAMVAAQAKSAAGNHNTAGKVDIGGGKFIDRSEVDKIAAERVQPLLDEINDLAEKERERLEAERLDEERRREKAEVEKMREREIQEIHKKLKGRPCKLFTCDELADIFPDQQKEDERTRKAGIKHDEKIRRDEAKAIKAEQKHAAKGDKEDALSHTTTGKTEAANPNPSSPEAGTRRSFTASRIRGLSMNFAKRQPKHKGKDAADRPLSADDSPTSPTQKVRAWLLSRFPRPRAKSAAASEDEKDSSDKKRGFIGGAALTRLHGGGGKTTSTRSADKGKNKELTENPASSMREVAMAGRTNPPSSKGDEPGESAATTTTKNTTTIVTTPSTPPPRPTSQVSQLSQTSLPTSELSQPQQQQQQEDQRRSVSSLSSSSAVSSGSSSNDKFVMARSEPETSGSTTLTPPRGSGGLALGGRASPFRESRFSEIL